MAEKKACRDVVVLVDALSGQLPDPERAEILAHMETCAVCCSNAELAIFDELLQLEAPANVRARLRERECQHAAERERERLAEGGERLVERERRAEGAPVLGDAVPDEAERRYAEFRRRVRETQREQMTRRWIPVTIIPLLASLLALGVFIAPPSQVVVVVRAETLLTQAAKTDAERPAGWTQRIRLRFTPDTATAATSTSTSTAISRSTSTSNQSLEWTYETSAAVDSDAPDNRPAIVPAATGPLLLALRLTQGERTPPFNWRIPLAANRFDIWRAMLRQRNDTVTNVDRFLVLKTTTPSGSIREGEIAMTRDGHHVVRQSWVVAYLGRLDIEELDAWVRPAAPPRTVDHLALERAELTARATLRALDLDLGGIRVHQSEKPEGVEIDGAVPSAFARETLTARLVTVPQIHIIVRVAPVPEPARVVMRRTASPHLASWLAEYGAGAEDRAALVPDIARRAPRLAQRLVAIQDLADRYTPDVVGKLPADAQMAFRRLVEAHFSALHSDMILLDEQLATFIGSAGRPIPPAQPPRDWRARAPRALREARALSALFTQLASPARKQDADPAASAELRAHLDALWRQLIPTETP